MPYYKTQGIILKRNDFYEADRIFTIYTRDFGKIQARGRGVKKSTSKLAGHLEPFLISDLMIARGKNFDQIAGSAISRNFLNLRFSWALGQKFLALFCLELTDELTKFGHPDKRIFELLEDIFETLDSKFSVQNDDNLSTYQSTNLIALTKIFALKLLTLLGYKPELYSCVSCKEKIKPQGNSFDFIEGGLVCSKCRQGDKERIPISDDSIKVLRLVTKRNLKDFLKIKAQEGLFKEINKIIDLYLKTYLDRPLKTLEFLEKMDVNT